MDIEMPLSKPKESQDQEGETDVLICQICTSTLSNPLTLSCYHHFCEKCLTDYMKKKPSSFAKCLKDNVKKKPGCFEKVTCPYCQHETEKGSVDQNCLLHDILNWRSLSEQNTEPSCQQCTEHHSVFSCVDCKINLCNKCQLSHLRIPVCKGHSIVALDKDAKLVIDRLVFCDKHPNEVIKFNCKLCECVLCIECKVIDHEGHETENVSDALRRLLPQIQKSLGKLQKLLGQRKNGILVIEKEIQKITDVHGVTKEVLFNRKQQLHDQIDELFKKIEEELENHGQEETGKLLEVTKDIKRTEKEIDGIVKWTGTILRSATNASLLVECQGRLRQRLEELENEAHVNTDREIEYEIPVLRKEEEFDIKFNASSILMQNKEILQLKNGSKMIPYGKITKRFHFSNLNGKKWKVIEHVAHRKDSKWWNKICIVNNRIWLPCSVKQAFSIYSSDGDYVCEMKLKDVTYPKVVCSIQDKVIVAGKSGLFSMDTNARRVEEAICRGNFSDVCVYNDVGYALAWEIGQVVVLDIDINGRVVCKDRIEVEYKDPHDSDRILVANDTIMISSLSLSKVYNFSLAGDLLSEHGKMDEEDLSPGSLHCPYLCACDTIGTALVIDHGHDRLLTLEKDGRWGLLEVEGLSWPIDVLPICENRMWCLNQNGRNLDILQSV